uniref:ATP synthase F0 subunit 8 n=1 Tax=Lasioglossum morio TaxID=88514 RepID=A0A0S2LSA5_9HYME|nr:ATP synthase F0 subunit 8 [Lasioglossum morio]
MPQMSPMYWTILLLLMITTTLIYLSMCYFTITSINHINKTSNLHSLKMFKIKWY